MRVHEITVNHDYTPEYLQWITHQASQYRSDILIKFEQESLYLDVKSLLGMIMFPVRRGARITIQTKGADEKEAIDAMCDWLENVRLPGA